MSDPRDELLDRIQADLYEIRQVTYAVHAKYATDPRGSLAECQWAFAAGACRAIAERVLRELEHFKRFQSNKTGSR